MDQDINLFIRESCEFTILHPTYYGLRESPKMDKTIN